MCSWEFIGSVSLLLATHSLFWRLGQSFSYTGFLTVCISLFRTLFGVAVFRSYFSGRKSEDSSPNRRKDPWSSTDLRRGKYVHRISNKSQTNGFSPNAICCSDLAIKLSRISFVARGVSPPSLSDLRSDRYCYLTFFSLCGLLLTELPRSLPNSEGLRQRVNLIRDGDIFPTVLSYSFFNTCHGFGVSEILWED